MVRNEERSDCSEMSGYGEHPNRKCISGSDGSLIPARSGDHTELWLLSVAKLIAKVRTFAADFCSKESPAEPVASKPLQKLGLLQRRGRTAVSVPMLPGARLLSGYVGSLPTSRRPL